MMCTHRSVSGDPHGMDPRIPLPEPLARLPFTTSTAHAAGVSENRLRGRDLQRPFHGVRIATRAPLTLEQRCRTLATRLPENAWFCGTTAAVLTGVPLPQRLEHDRTVHVAVAHPARAPRGKNIRGHSYREADHRSWHGLRVSSPERLWMQLATELALKDLIAAGDYLVHYRLPHTTIQNLTEALARAEHVRGIRACRAALPLLSTRAESRRESHLRVLLLTSGFEGLHVNMRITVTGGWRYRGDLAFPSARMIVEYQGDEHRDPKKYRDDLTRISRLEADGWYVMQVTGGDLDNPGELVERIHRALSSRLSYVALRAAQSS